MKKKSGFICAYCERFFESVAAIGRHRCPKMVDEGKKANTKPFYESEANL